MYKKLIRWDDLDPMIIGTPWTGVRWDATLPGTVMTRVGVSPDEIFQDIELVALSDAGNVNAVLATYASQEISGAVDGSNGQVMVRIPKKYYREVLNAAGDLCGFDMSNYPISGFKLHEKFTWGAGRGEIFVGAYEAGEAGSILNSISGVALSHSHTIGDFRIMAGNRGLGWHDYDFYTHHLLQMLFYLYYADLNSQSVLPGYTEHAWDSSYKRLTGRTNSLIQHRGYVNAIDGGVDADLVAGWNNSSRVVANRFLWIENLYGHCWKFLDGVAFDGRIGQPNTAYVTPDPFYFTSVEADILTNYINLNINMPVAGDANYIQTLGNLFIPKTFGGNSSTYVTDYFWSYLDYAPNNYLRVVLSGGGLNTGGPAGVAARSSDYDFAYASSDLVSRLCFERNILL